MRTSSDEKVDKIIRAVFPPTPDTPEYFALRKRIKPVQDLRVLADDKMSVELDCFGGTDAGVSLQRDIEAVPHPAGFDHRFGGRQPVDSAPDIIVHNGLCNLETKIAKQK